MKNNMKQIVEDKVKRKIKVIRKKGMKKRNKRNIQNIKESEKNNKKYVKHKIIKNKKEA
jgi:hypothetical protein